MRDRSGRAARNKSRASRVRHERGRVKRSPRCPRRPACHACADWRIIRPCHARRTGGGRVFSACSAPPGSSCSSSAASPPSPTSSTAGWPAPSSSDLRRPSWCPAAGGRTRTRCSPTPRCAGPSAPSRFRRRGCRRSSCSPATMHEIDARVRLARGLGIDAESLLPAPGAHTTREEAALLEGLLKPRGVQRILLVVDPIDMPRTRALLERAASPCSAPTRKAAGPPGPRRACICCARWASSSPPGATTACAAGSERWISRPWWCRRWCS